MGVLENLEPKRVMYYFEQISQIPRGSGNEEQISNYLVDFAKSHNLEYIQDHLNNVIIFKKATAGYEEAPAVILQGHMDMVCEKKEGSSHDFTKDPLKLEVKDGYISAQDTTLGGDDGIAIAYGLALLEGDQYPHPALEFIATVDEEIGLLGAEGIDCSPLKGTRMINLDSEEEGNLWISCAGGLRGNSEIPVQYVQGEGTALEIEISGLTGGHSGAEIDKNRANANLLMGRFLYGLKKAADYEIAALAGGLKDNAIPRQSVSTILVAQEEKEAVLAYAEKVQGDLRSEYQGSDENITISVKEKGYMSERVLHPVSREKVLFYLNQIPNGVQKMSGSIKGLVETSTNLGILKLAETRLYASSSVRSSVEAARDALSDKIEHLTEFLGGDYEVYGAYPAWEYRKESPLRELMVNVYEKEYGQSPNVVAIHAGLECGLFYKKIADLDCVSVGPNMHDIHTTEERLEIASVERVWKYLLRVLEEMKNA